jgi:GNAT superfamily N-acetyltransferase
VDDGSLLELYDRGLRRRPTGASELLADGRVQVEIHDIWAGVTWSGLDAQSADAAIGAAIARLAPLERAWEWTLCSYDEPADLGTRLERAGFVPDPPEALAVGPVDELDFGPAPPDGLTIEYPSEPRAVRETLAAQAEAFGGEPPGMFEYLMHELSATPPRSAAVLARLNGEPVGGARLAFHPDGEFASFYGTGVLPQWRGLGVFRAIMRACATTAAARGVRYLQGDLNDQSRPILGRCGLRMLATTTPYRWPGEAQAADAAQGQSAAALAVPA